MQEEAPSLCLNVDGLNMFLDTSTGENSFTSVGREMFILSLNHKVYIACRDYPLVKRFTELICLLIRRPLFLQL